MVKCAVVCLLFYHASIHPSSSSHVFCNDQSALPADSNIEEGLLKLSFKTVEVSNHHFSLLPSQYHMTYKMGGFFLAFAPERCPPGKDGIDKGYQKATEWWIFVRLKRRWLFKGEALMIISWGGGLEEASHVSANMPITDCDCSQDSGGGNTSRKVSELCVHVWHEYNFISRKQGVAFQHCCHGHAKQAILQLDKAALLVRGFQCDNPPALCQVALGSRRSNRGWSKPHHKSKFSQFTIHYDEYYKMCNQSLYTLGH